MPKNELRNCCHGLDQLPSTQPEQPDKYRGCGYNELHVSVLWQARTDQRSIFFEDFASISVMLEEVPFSNSIINNVVFDIGVQDKSRGG